MSVFDSCGRGRGRERVMVVRGYKECVHVWCFVVVRAFKADGVVLCDCSGCACIQRCAFSRSALGGALGVFTKSGGSCVQSQKKMRVSNSLMKRAFVDKLGTATVFFASAPVVELFFGGFEYGHCLRLRLLQQGLSIGVGTPVMWHFERLVFQLKVSSSLTRNTQVFS